MDPVASTPGTTSGTEEMKAREAGRGRCASTRRILSPPASVLPEVSVLRDGRVALVRAAAPEDAELLRGMFSRLSQASIYRRFHAPYPWVPDRAVTQALRADNRDTLSLVALIDGEVVGQAIYVRLAKSDEAEAAVVVEDGWQRHGIGSLLLSRLAEEGRLRGIKALTGAVLRENGAMRALLAPAGALRYSKRDGVFLARVPLRASSRTRLTDTPAQGERARTGGDVPKRARATQRDSDDDRVREPG